MDTWYFRATTHANSNPFAILCKRKTFIPFIGKGRRFLFVLPPYLHKFLAKFTSVSTIYQRTNLHQVSYKTKHSYASLQLFQHFSTITYGLRHRLLLSAWDKFRMQLKDVFKKILPAPLIQRLLSVGGISSTFSHHSLLHINRIIKKNPMLVNYFKEFLPLSFS